jgi:hypothetical protein
MAIRAGSVPAVGPRGKAGSFVRWLVGLCVAASLVVGIPRVAPAQESLTNAQIHAQLVATVLINSYLPTAAHSGFCDTRDQAGWLDGHGMYRDSCATNDGKFLFIVYVNAARRFDLTTANADALALLNERGICAAESGVATTNGIKDKFFEVHAGTDTSTNSTANVSFKITAKLYKKRKGYETRVLCS